MRRLIFCLIVLSLCVNEANAQNILKGLDNVLSNTRIAAGDKMISDTLIFLPDLPYPEANFQSKHLGADYDFVLYLLDNNLKEDATVLLRSEPYFHTDTLHYLRAWTDFNSRRISQASKSFDLVGKSSAFYDKSLFYNVVSNAHLGIYQKCNSLLDSYKGPYQDMRALQYAGIAILQDDKEAFMLASSSIVAGNYAIDNAMGAISSIYDERFNAAEKSPFVAALASAIIPGAGKMYVGKIGEGVSSLLIIGAFTAMTVESWKKAGPTNWQTILCGVCNAALYLGNIYGSYVSVKIYKDELRQKQNTTVLLNIHIPLRTIFD